MRQKPLRDKAPLFCLNQFSPKAEVNSFYIEKLPAHLKNHDFISKPHNHDFYLLLYITKGKGTHTIDFKTYPLKPQSFFLMTPGQVHSWKLSSDIDGYIIFFMKEFYQLQLNENSLLEFPFFHSLNANPFIQLKSDRIIDAIIQEMYKEFSDSSDLIDLRILRSYLDLLLLKLAREYPDAPDNSVNASSSVFKIRKLEQLIEKNFIDLKQPREYAALMNISASYLNTICKETLGKTLSDLINERIILEAKRLFSYSDMTVNEVSYSLKFSSPSYFVRFFKKNKRNIKNSLQ